MKRNWFSRILSLVLVAFLLLPNFGIVARGENAQPERSYELQSAAANVEKASKKLVYEGSSGAPEGVVLNYRSMPSINASFEGTDINPVKGTLPGSYSSAWNIPGTMAVEQKGDYIAAVEDQGSTGTCWAHSAINGAESGYMKANGLTGTWSGIDWNEYHLVYYFWNTPQDPLGLWGGDRVSNVSGKDDLMVGGNSVFTMYAYANWIGASADQNYDAEDVLYGVGYGDTNFAFNAAAHLENGYSITLPTSYYGFSWDDMAVAKQMIMDYGSIDISYCAAHQGNWWKDNMYQYCDVAYISNHAVSIVGWNDNIPADAFGITAPGPGAWLVKNSWGDWWGQGGYFWLSYYDASLEYAAYAYDFTNANTYDNNYQYDGGVCPTTGYRSYESITGANVFYADSDEMIEAIGIWTFENNTNYEIKIYTGLGATSLPTDGALESTKSGTLTYAGFHTIDIPNVAVSPGERYAVVVTESNSGTYAWMPVDETYNGGWIDSYSYAKEGQSYLYDSYYGWQDLNSGNTYYSDGINLRIKAYTNESAPVGKFASYDGCDFWRDANGNVTCIRQSDGSSVINEFKCDGTYTYYFQADGTAMRDRLTYHPDGVHVIYFDEYGHEVFSNFANVKKTISGQSVDDYCFFDVYGYLYVDVVTYDQTGTKLYYANPYGVMDRGKWFEFSDSVKWADGTPFDKAGGKYGYANADGTLMKDTYTYNWEGRLVYMQGNGVMMYVN